MMEMIWKRWKNRKGFGIGGQGNLQKGFFLKKARLDCRPSLVYSLLSPKEKTIKRSDPYEDAGDLFQPDR